MQAYSLPGAWSAAFGEENGVHCRLPLCCVSEHPPPSLRVHFQPLPPNPYSSDWEELPWRPLSQRAELAAALPEAAAAAADGSGG
eukprot:COSAG01_NODE_14828_length_1405_cov_1.424962_2_plen_84_part_01